MLDSYRRILTLPGALLFSLTGLVARLPISMIGFGIVLIVSDRTGSYALAGTISAAFVLAGAAGSPVQGRLVDRYRQSKVLPVAALVFAVGMALLIGAIEAGAPTPVPHLSAAVAGIGCPQVGSMVRARWSHAIEDRSMVRIAFAFEAVVDEVIFIVGPVVIILLATLVDPAAGLVFAGIAGVVGGVLLAVQRATEPSVTDEGHGEQLRYRLGWIGLAPLVLASAGLGMLFGSAEVVTVAFAEEQGTRAAAGFMLAVWAAGSLIAGVAIGAYAPKISTLMQFRIAATVLTLSFVPLLFLDSIALVTAGLLLSGLAISPCLIATISLVEQAVPRLRLTEGIAWATTGLAIGVAPGAALSGLVVDTYGASAAYLVPLAGGAVAAGVAWAIRGRRPPAVAEHAIPASER